MQDRPLTHINKKGRPVSQCPHCRGLRKSRASHVKCECGDKPHGKEDCAQLKADSKRELSDDDLDTISDQRAVDSSICCCSHGSRCTCALKKEYLDPVPEIDVPEISPSPPSTEPRKPRLSTTHSDSSLTVFVNGHPKPTHKHNDAAHKCGVPYKIPRPHTIHGHSSITQKSMDHLPLINTQNEGRSQNRNSMFNVRQNVRLVRSEHGSPELSPVANLDQFNMQIPSLDLSYSTFNNFTTSPIGEDYNGQVANGFEYFSPLEDQPSFSAGLEMPVDDWSAVDLPLENPAYSTVYSQPPSYASFDHSNVGYPGLTASSSGDVSEAEEALLQGLPSPVVVDNNPYTSSVSESTSTENYRLSSASSYLGMPQVSLLAGASIDDLDIDAYLQAASASPASFEEFPTTAPADPETFTGHGLTVQDAQKFAHLGAPTQEMGELSIPTTTNSSDPLWAASFNGESFSGEDSNFDSEDQLPDGIWRS